MEIGRVLTFLTAFCGERGAGRGAGEGADALRSQLRRTGLNRGQQRATDVNCVLDATGELFQWERSRFSTLCDAFVLCDVLPISQKRRTTALE